MALPRPLVAPLIGIGLVVSLASSFPAIAIGLRDFDPLAMAALRLLIAAFVGLAVLLWRGWKRPSGFELMLLVLGGLTTAGGFVMGNAGQLTVSIGPASFILGSQPLFVALFGVLLFGESFARRNWLGLALAMAGLALVSFGQPGGIRIGAGIGLLIGSTLSGAATALLQRRLVPSFDPYRTSAFLLGLGALWASPWLGEGLAQASEASPAALWAVLYLAIVPTFFGQLFFALSVSLLGVIRTGLIFYLVPVAASVIAYLWFGQIPSLVTIVGCLVLISGVILATRRP